jgi:hypothetical protein
MRLLTHLAQSLPQTENLASEALVFILANSPTARRALTEYLTHPNLDIPKELAFRSQVKDESETIPDIVGVDEDGVEHVLIEAKFWAGLTDNQPVEYLNRMASKSGVLLFLVPDARLETLWPELVRRCEDARMTPTPVEIASRHWRCARVGAKQMGITSWRRLLAYLSGAVVKAGERDAAQDIEQLKDLCDRMDSDAFLPLTGGDLAPQIGRRFAQFCDLVDRATEVLVQKGIADKKNLRTKGIKGTYGQYFRLKGCGCCLGVDPYLWSTHAETPIWLDVSDENWKRTGAIKAALRTLFNSNPPRAYQTEGLFCIPIYLPLKSEQDTVLRDIVKQIESIEALLPDRRNAEQSPPPYGSPAADSRSGEA